MADAESFFERAFRVFRQKLSARANRLDDPAEAIDLVMTQQMEAIASARTDLAVVVTAEKRLEMLQSEFETRAARERQAARTARASHNEPAALTAMRRAIEGDRLAADARASAAEVVAQRRVLESLLEEMRAQYERLRLRREASRALATAARAVADGHQSIAPTALDDREVLLRRAHDTLAEVRARAMALAELRSSGALTPMDGADANIPIAEDEVRKRLNELD
jgi:phage shock protein A